MEKIDFIEYDNMLKKNQVDFLKCFYSDLINIINKYKIVEPNDNHIKDIIPKDPKCYIKDFFNKFSLYPKVIYSDLSSEYFNDSISSIALSKYYTNINAFIRNGSNFHNKNVNCQLHHIDKVQFLTIYFDYLKDDYYLIDIILFNRNSDFNSIILNELGIKNKYQIILDQKSELNSFIKSVKNLLN